MPCSDDSFNAPSMHSADIKPLMDAWLIPTNMPMNRLRMIVRCRSVSLIGFIDLVHPEGLEPSSTV